MQATLNNLLQAGLKCLFIVYCIVDLLTLILLMQSVVLDARMHESLAKAARVAGDTTAARALASSAHFLCSGSDTAHHRIFLAAMKGAVQMVKERK